MLKQKKKLVYGQFKPANTVHAYDSTGFNTLLVKPPVATVAPPPLSALENRSETYESRHQNRFKHAGTLWNTEIYQAVIDLISNVSSFGSKVTFVYETELRGVVD